MRAPSHVARDESNPSRGSRTAPRFIGKMAIGDFASISLQINQTGVEQRRTGRCVGDFSLFIQRQPRNQPLTWVLG